MKTFVITKGGVARIMSAIDSISDPMDAIAKWHPDDRAEVTATRRIESADIPPQATLKDAWRDTGSAIRVDMPVARTLVTARVRTERDRRLAETDKEVLTLDGEAIPGLLKAKRQALRDLPISVQADLDAITTPEALEAYEPAWP